MKEKRVLELKDKVAVVTGGGTGIGKAIAVAFAKEGAFVVVASRNEANLNKVVKGIQTNGGKASAIASDISCHHQAREMVLHTVNEYGRIDILVNNTGIAGPTAAVLDLKIEDWDKTLAINLTGAMLCSREVINFMIPQERGNIVNISARAGIHGFVLRSPYSVSKAGLINFTQTLAMEVGKYNIRVNCVSPGPVEGERARKVIVDKSRALNVPVEEIVLEKISKIGLGRFVTSEEIANAVIFLASEKSSGITGQNLIVDGGFIYS